MVDNLRELQERTRDWYSSFPQPLAKWAEEEIIRLRERVAELEKQLAAKPLPLPQPKRRSRKRVKD